MLATAMELKSAAWPIFWVPLSSKKILFTIMIMYKILTIFADSFIQISDFKFCAEILEQEMQFFMMKNISEQYKQYKSNTKAEGHIPVFYRLYKVFNKVWHKELFGLLGKLDLIWERY